jgi:integral membrane protein (TIGR01906 family)
MKKIIILFLILSIPFLCLFTAARLLIFNENYYHNQFRALNVQIPNPDALMYNITSYFKNEESILHISIFTKEELQHMQDVKTLINRSLLFFYLLIIVNLGLYCLLLHRNQNKLQILSKILLIGSLLNLLVITLSYTLKSQFSAIFIRFHEVFFSQGNWQFPATSNLLKLFPEAFFSNFLYTTIGISAIISAVLLIASLIYIVLAWVKK